MSASRTPSWPLRKGCGNFPLMSAKKVKVERRGVTRIEPLRPAAPPPKRWPLLTIRVLAALGLGNATYLSVLHYQAGAGATGRSASIPVTPRRSTFTFLADIREKLPYPFLNGQEGGYDLRLQGQMWKGNSRDL